MKNKDLIICSMFCAITCIASQISIPFVGGVPLTMQTLAVSLSGIILKSKKAFISQLLYIIIGAIGVPVFSGFKGGISTILGPTGGFILSFPIMAFVIGYILEKTNKKSVYFLSLIIGLLINYICGVVQFMIITKSSLIASLTCCVFPFLFTDIIKIIIASVVGYKINNTTSLKNLIN